jgi:hypothetical protein
MVANAIHTESIRAQTYREFLERGVIPDYEGIRARVQAEASPCPRCHMLVHPDMAERHNKVHHPEIIRLPTTPVICDHATKFSIKQMVRIAGTSHTLPIAEVKVLSKTWYRFEIGAGDVSHFWVEEERLSVVTKPQTILTIPVKRSEEIKYPLGFPNCLAIVVYQPQPVL